MAETSAVGSVTASTQQTLVNGAGVTITVKEFNAKVHLNDKNSKVSLLLKIGTISLLDAKYKDGEQVRITSNVSNGASKNVTLLVTPENGDSDIRAHEIEWALRWDQ